MASISFISEEQSTIVGKVRGNHIDLNKLVERYTEYGTWTVRENQIDSLWVSFYPDNITDIEDKIRAGNEVLQAVFTEGITYSQIPITANVVPMYRIPLQQEDASTKWFCVQIEKTTGDLFHFVRGTTTFNDQLHSYYRGGDGWNGGYYQEDSWYYSDLDPYRPFSKFSVATILYNGKQYLLACGVGVDRQSGNIQFFATDYTTLGIPDISNFDEEYGEESTEDGYNVGGLPSFDDSSVSIGIPSDPNISVSNLGFLNTYKVTSAGLEGMLNELFPDEPLPIIPQPSEGGFLSDVAYSINALSSTVGNLFTSFINSNLMQYVVDVHAIPVSPDTVGSANVKIGFKELQTTAQKVVHDYVTVDCGSLSLDEFRKNFTDYALCKYQLYLPFVGVVPIQPSLFLGTGGKINVTYKFNIIDGSFTAFISCTSSKSKLKNSVVGQYSGNCCVHIPITTNSYSNIVSGLVSGVSHSISAVEGSKLNVSGGADELMSAVGTTMTQPAYNLSNGYNATSSFMGVRVPYFIISRPVQSFSAEYPHEKGLPLNVTYKLSQLVGSGFTVCDSPHIDIECSEYERAEIERALTTGIVL